MRQFWGWLYAVLAEKYISLPEEGKRLIQILIVFQSIQPCQCEYDTIHLTPIMSLVLRRRVSATKPRESSAWRAARDEFCLNLGEDEKKLFLTSSPNKPQDLVKNVVMAEIEYSATSSLRCRTRRLRNVIEAFDQFNYVVDAFAEVYPQALYPIWGCVRVVLQVRTLFT